LERQKANRRQVAIPGDESAVAGPSPATMNWMCR
jgi:hypothetical protein